MESRKPWRKVAEALSTDDQKQHEEEPPKMAGLGQGPEEPALQGASAVGSGARIMPQTMELPDLGQGPEERALQEARVIGRVARIMPQAKVLSALGQSPEEQARQEARVIGRDARIMPHTMELAALGQGPEEQGQGPDCRPDLTGDRPSLQGGGTKPQSEGGDVGRQG
ncbi:uncharacterized protein LOC116802203 isoform X3 [Drosophila sechellia]|uniref:uncharacterized protein LOC116802203 isoform X3 n=1 Tax=Drosophila sechellia TaxID=7238 RepID=UPI0013DDCC76|nr:uncharacterized protein LOC116802203 isoform X3 [Drosophila sechellia]